jgi:predicted permease
MRKRTVRNGMRLIIASLILIVLASFYHEQLSDLFSLLPAAESRFYRLGIFWAAAIGGYGVVVTVFGFVLSPDKKDAQIRLMPIVLVISAMIFIFFYLLSSSIKDPGRDEQRRIRPGETITI